MAWSPYWPHPIYLDIYIVFTYFITGCNASETSGAMIGIIAGSIIAFILLVAGIVGIVYYIIKSQRSREAKKQQIKQTSNNMDYRTVVVRRMPAASIRHPAMMGYPEVMVEYHASVHGHPRPKIPMASHMATIGHMPVQRPPTMPMAYYTSRPRKPHQTSRDKFIEDRKSKHKSRSRSNPPVSNSLSNRRISDMHSPKDSWSERETQFILRKKEDSHYPIANSQSKPNEPFTLTSLFTRNGETSARPESRYYLTTKDESPKEETETETYEPVGFPAAYLQQPSPAQEQQISSYPERSESPERDFEKDNTEAERPVTPDYDVSSILDEDVTTPDEGVTIPDITLTDGSKFSYAAATELRQNSRFRLSSNVTDDPTVDPFGSNSKSVQLNPLFDQEGNSPIETSRLNPGSYGTIPRAPSVLPE